TATPWRRRVPGRAVTPSATRSGGTSPAAGRPIRRAGPEPARQQRQKERPRRKAGPFRISAAGRRLDGQRRLLFARRCRRFLLWRHHSIGSTDREEQPEQVEDTEL